MKIIRLEVYLLEDTEENELESIRIDCEDAIDELDEVSHVLSEIVEVEDEP